MDFPCRAGGCLLTIAWCIVLADRSLASELDCKTFALNAGEMSVVFEKSPDGRTWDIIHLGASVPASDAAELSGAQTKVAYHLQNRPSSYSVLGDRSMTTINRGGGFAATHADGGLSTLLIAEKAERIPDVEGAEHVVLHFRDETHPLYIDQHFRALEDCSVVETWIDVRNDEGGSVRLSRMDSFAVDFPVLADEYHVLHLSGQYGGEAQVFENELNRGETIAFGSTSGVRDSFESNAGLMVSIGRAADETSGTVLGGVLCWSGIWQISASRTGVDALSLRAGVENRFGAYVLDTGKSITLPVFAFTWTNGGKGQVTRNIHRWARKWRLPAGHKDRPVLLNSWEGSYFSFTEKTLVDMMDGVKEMGGEMFVVDDGWFGVGKYARDDIRKDTVGLGDWVANPKKLPRGLVSLSDAAKKRGLRFGLWIEPEMICTNSWLYERHPDWILREKTRPVRVDRGNSQTVLDLANPAVRDNILAQLDALRKSTPGLAYWKWDANCDFLNLGSPYLDAGHQANFPFDYTKGVYDLLARLRALDPNIDIQACSSGGGHADYGFLQYSDEIWGSDYTDARERIFIQWGEQMFYPAQTVGAHVTVCPNLQTGRSTPLKFRFDVAMSGRLGFELHPGDLTPEERVYAKACVETYKRIRPTVQRGDLYRLVSPYGHSRASVMFVNETKTHAIVFLWGLERSQPRDVVPPLKLQGLDADRRYRIGELNCLAGMAGHSRAVGKIVGGKALSEVGLPARLAGDHDSAVFELTDVDEGATER